jgi:cold shock protein
LTGKIKWFNGKKGYGFILAETEPQQEFFCHVRELDQNLIDSTTGFVHLREGDKVAFTPSANSKGNLALRVTKG